MTEDKKRKRDIRQRMKMSGESYTAARSKVLKLPGSAPPEAEPRGAAFTMEYAGGRISGDSEVHVRRVVAELEEGRAKRARWARNGRQALSQLGRLFPSMRDVPGVDPWEEDALLEWLCGPAPTSGSFAAAMFLLGVYNSSVDWAQVAHERGLLEALPSPTSPLRRFDLFRAMSCWDRDHVAAFRAWVDAPFIP